MNRSRLQKLSRKWHRVFAPLIGIQLIFWTLGGLYFSWFHLDNVHGDYERAEAAVADLLGSTGMVSVESLLERSTLDRVKDVRVGKLMDRTVIRLYRDMDRVETYDAFSGELLSPITETKAREIADGDFTPEAEIVAVQLVEEKGGEYKNAVPAYRVDFGNWKSTHVYVHANTGLVTARRNSIWRGFDFLWMLHIVDFQNRENINNWLLRILSVFGMATVLSGYLLWILTTPLFRRGRKTQSASHPKPVSGT